MSAPVALRPPINKELEPCAQVPCCITATHTRLSPQLQSAGGGSGSGVAKRQKNNDHGQEAHDWSVKNDG